MLRGLAIRLLLALLVAVPAAAGQARAPGDAGIGEIPLAALPAEARHTLRLIKLGGPFPYRRDGVVFQNREKLLPVRPHGHYREYTVTTPQTRDRGARRIVAARGATGDVRNSGEYYYTEDHYRSFRRIRE